MVLFYRTKMPSKEQKKRALRKKRYLDKVVSVSKCQVDDSNLTGTSSALAKVEKQREISLEKKRADARAYSKRVYRADPDKKKAYSQASYRDDPEKKKAYSQASYRDDPEKRRVILSELIVQMLKKGKDQALLGIAGMHELYFAP